MSTLHIEFSVSCETNFGEQVCICGGTSLFGDWVPQKGLFLATDPKRYPLWTNITPVCLRAGEQIQFKLCVLSGAGELLRWQDIRGNRSLCPKSSILIEFTESDASMIFRTPRRHSSNFLRVQNVRKGTDEVFNEWGSESSSNKEMWLEHQAQDADEEQGSLLLTQFSSQLTRLVASQREQNFPSVQLQPELQLQHQLDFGDYGHHQAHCQYVVVGEEEEGIRRQGDGEDKIVVLTRDGLKRLRFNSVEEVAVFHILQCSDGEEVCETVQEVSKYWRLATSGQMRGLIIAYFQTDPKLDALKKLVERGVNAFVVSTLQSANNVLSTLTTLKYKIYCSKPDVFTARNNKGHQVKLIVRNLKREQLLDNFQQQLQEMKRKVMSDFYFSFSSEEFNTRLSENLSLWKMSKSQCLIILQIWRLDQLQNKTIFDLIHLSSQRFKVIVFVITHQRFPKNIQHKIPVAKHKVIFMNTFGDIYANTGQVIDMFYYLEVAKNSFQTNQNIILEQLGTGIQRYYWRNCSLVVDFPRNALGEVLRKRAMYLTRDVNNKSIAKLIVQANDTSLEFVPFCLHLSFLYKVILSTFAARLKSYEKGMVISIDGTDLSALSYLQIPEGPERSMRFLRFCLNTKEKRTSYACNPMNESQLRRMIELISEECEEEGKLEPLRKQVLGEIMNVR